MQLQIGYSYIHQFIIILPNKQLFGGSHMYSHGGVDRIWTLKKNTETSGRCWEDVQEELIFIHP